MIHPNSRAANESIQPAISEMEARILNAIRASGARGLTRDEVSQETGILIQTVTGRVLRLVQLKFVVETDVNRCTRTGRMASVLVAADKTQQLELAV